MNEREIFVAALNKADPTERAAYLAEACGDDLALRERLEALLREQEKLGSFLESPAPAPAEFATADDPITEGPGTVIGPYKLLEQIGEGGFGVVFMAEQTEPVRRKVALKVLKPGMDTRQVVARFEAERQALAIMDHPNIARVFDGGLTGASLTGASVEPSGRRDTADPRRADTRRADAATLAAGRPYFVMELVKGVPITEFCDQHLLTPRQRLELFIPVCQAVQHAHQKGIIHRDLKPSNVLVTMHDTAPVVKVIDFGVAKALGQELTDKTLFTGFAQMIGTPLYMSPEQAGQSGLDIDTRSDIYSLGVLLYELLTGTTPFTKERFKQAAYDEIRRIICEEEPPKPSTRLSESKDSLPSISAQRHMEPTKLTKLVRGELDWIVMKALEKDRSRRYATANGLAMDVRRYLNDETVLACPPSAGYRLRKFAWRHKRAVAVVIAATLLLFMALGALALHSSMVGRQRDELRRKSYFHLIALAAAYNEAGPRPRMLKALQDCPRELRGWEWYRLSWLADRSSRTFEGHSERVTSLAYSADGKWLVSGSWDSTVRVWDVATGNELWARGAQAGQVLCVVVSPNARRIASGHEDATLVLWDAATGNEVRRIRGHQGKVGALAFRPDGRWIVSGSDDKQLFLWDASADMAPRALGCHDDAVQAVAFAPDGNRVVSGDRDGFLKVWELTTKTELTRIQAHESDVYTVAFGPDSKRIVSGGRDRSVRLWDADTGQRLGTFRGHSHWIASVAFSADGRRLATASADGSIRVWDIDKEEELLTLRGHSGPVYAVTSSPDGHWIASGDWNGCIKLWDLAAADIAPTIRGHTGEVYCVVFSPDGRLLASASADGTVRIWDAATREPLRILEGHGKTVWAVAFTPDGRRVVSAGADGTLRIWDVAADKELHKLEGHRGAVYGVAVHPDGKWLVSASEDKTLKLWDAATGNEVQTLAGHEDEVFAVAVSPNGEWIASGSWKEPTVRLWSAANGREVRTLRGHSGGISCIAFSPDGKQLVSCCMFAARPRRPGEIKTWDVGTGRERLTLAGLGPCRWVVFSPDGKRLAAAHLAGWVALWDADRGEPTLECRGHTLEAYGVAFSPDGRRLASAGRDCTLRIYDSMPPD